MKTDRNKSTENKNGYFDNEDTARLLTKNAGGRNKMFIAVAVIALAALLAAVICMIVLLGHDKGGGQTTPEAGTGTSESVAHESGSDDLTYETGNKEINEIYRAYAGVLEKNETGIRNYSWQNDNGRRCVAIYDLNGDGTPELMFFSSESESLADLHVYTYENGGAVECSYGSGQPVNNTYDMDGTSMFTDVNVAAGTKYMIYAGREPNSVYIAYSMGDETMYYHNVRCALGAGNAISIVRDVENRYGPNDDYTKTLDRYYVNGKEVSGKEGAAEFGKAAKDLDRLLMYSGFIEDMTVFEYVNTQTPIAVSYDEAIRICSN